MSKSRLVFDVTDASTILSSDSVGAYVRSSDGTLITNTGTALDVHFTNTSINVADGGGSLTVDAIDLDIRNLSAAQDNVAAYLSDAAGNAITSTAGALDVNLKSPITVDVSLSHINDSVRLGDGTNLNTFTNVGAKYGVDVNLINSSIAVTATDLDIRDLVAASDAVSSWTKDGAGNSIGSVGDSLKVNLTNTITTSDAALANTAVKAKSNAIDVANTAEDVVAVADVLANRKYLYLYNSGNREVFIGETGVTVANGYPIFPGSELQLRIGSAVDLEFIGQVGVSGANATLKTLQLS